MYVFEADLNLLKFKSSNKELFVLLQLNHVIQVV